MNRRIRGSAQAIVGCGSAKSEHWLRELPHWVNLRRSPGVLPTSGAGVRAEAIGPKADIGT